MMWAIWVVITDVDDDADDDFVEYDNNGDEYKPCQGIHVVWKQNFVFDLCYATSGELCPLSIFSCFLHF